MHRFLITDNRLIAYAQHRPCDCGSGFASLVVKSARVVLPNESLVPDLGVYSVPVSYEYPKKRGGFFVSGYQVRNRVLMMRMESLTSFQEMPHVAFASVIPWSASTVTSHLVRHFLN